MSRESTIQVTELDERAKTNMAEYSPQLALARRLLAHEAGGRRGSEEIVEAADVVCQKLRQHLGKRIGPAGFDSLLARALHLSKRQFAFLERVKFEQGGSACLTGSRESVQGHDPAEVGEGFATLLASFLWLLGKFVGDDMALRQITTLWPEVLIRDVVPGTKETSE